ncbi:hypothetical protein D3C86_1400510 [compost metagenome]
MSARSPAAARTLASPAQSRLARQIVLPSFLTAVRRSSWNRGDHARRAALFDRLRTVSSRLTGSADRSPLSVPPTGSIAPLADRSHSRPSATSLAETSPTLVSRSGTDARRCVTATGPPGSSRHQSNRSLSGLRA